MEFLHVVLGILLDILAETLLDLFLQTLDSLTAGIAHRHLCSLCLCLALLYEFAYGGLL